MNLPVDTTPPAAPVVSVTGTTSSTVGLSWPAVADDDYTCCIYRVFANGSLVARVAARRSSQPSESGRSPSTS